MKILLYTLVMSLFFLNDLQSSRGSRGSSAPYISGDTFRSIADVIYDEEHKNIPISEIKNGDIVFIKGDYLTKFIQTYLPKISYSIILIIHNSDEAFPGKVDPEFLTSKKIIAVYAQNVENYHHEKVFSIPIGIANRCWPHGDITIFDRIIDKAPHEKPYLLYMNFSPGTYPPERPYVFDLFKNKAFCTIGSYKNLEGYLTEMSQHKFTLSPRGNGLDCHRTWEALLVRTIPIVFSSTLDILYKNLPVLIINDWADINEEFLTKKYAEFQQQDYAYEKLFASYWLEKIKKKQRRWLRKTHGI